MKNAPKCVHCGSTNLYYSVEIPYEYKYRITKQGKISKTCTKEPLGDAQFDKLVCEDCRAEMWFDIDKHGIVIPFKA